MATNKQHTFTMSNRRYNQILEFLSSFSVDYSGLDEDEILDLFISTSIGTHEMTKSMSDQLVKNTMMLSHIIMAISGDIDEDELDLVTLQEDGVDADLAAEIDAAFSSSIKEFRDAVKSINATKGGNL